MKLCMQNVGKILKPAEIEINGITILAGENGTGKSTIGKMLYCVFSCFYDYEHNISEQRIISIMKTIRRYSGYKGTIRREPFAVKEKIVEQIERFNVNGDDDELKAFLSDVTDIAVDEVPYELIASVGDLMKATDEDILSTMLERTLYAEFNSQLGHVNWQDLPTKVDVQIKNNAIRFEKRGNNNKLEIYEKIKLVKDIVYIDDPYVLDSVDEMSNNNSVFHRHRLIAKLRGGQKNDFSIVEDVVINNSLKEIHAKLSTICNGQLRNTSDGSVTYLDGKLKEELALKNLSTGLKSFVMLKTLLQKGYLERNGMVVLDEPETHQNPEWLKIYAEIIVLLQKVFDINFLISTHSVDFLNFIELYSDKYEIKNRCKYYMLLNNSLDDSISDVVEMTGNLENIYSELSMPFLRAVEELEGMYES